VAYISGQDESFGGPTMMVGARRADVFFDASMARDERYSQFSNPASLAVPFQVVEREVGRFLDARTDRRPLFLYVNLHDTHFPYWHRRIAPILNTTILTPPEMTGARQPELRSMYMNSVANVDASIGRLLKVTRDHLPKAPVVIVASDHGESLLEAGFLGHGYAVTEAQTRIPFIVSGLDFRIAQPFGQADFRDALARSLGAPGVQSAAGGGTVFQYIGSMTRPTEIAERSESGQIVLDFDTRRVRFGDGLWRPLESLNALEARSFEHLVWSWESMLLARRARGSP
jgi:hypothetical protein